jgi:hypothetical protein
MDALVPPLSPPLPPQGASPSWAASPGARSPPSGAGAGGTRVTLLTHAYLTTGVPMRYRTVLSNALDALGAASATAQRLGAVITTAAKLSGAPEQRTYIAYEGSAALGFIKVGPRQLFISVPGYVREGGGGGSGGAGAGGGARGSRADAYRAGEGGLGPRMVEMAPLCVLDFFVFEAYR